MGSPDFAAQILSGLATKYPIVGVFTQPDRESGRGKILTPPPVKATAIELNIPVYQPQKLKSPEAFADLAALEPDVIVVAAYGQILRQNVLDLPKFGCLNVHASYLPRWRGAAPIQAAILAGDEYSGVSIMKMDAGIDTGPLLAQENAAINAQETAKTLENKLAKLGSDLLLRTLPQYLDGKIAPKPQTIDGSTYASMLTKQEGLLDFTRPAVELERKIRAYDDWPGTYILVNGQMLKIRKSRVIESQGLVSSKRGSVEGFPVVDTADGTLVLIEVQPAGKKWMSGVDFLRGYQKNWLAG
jgi:methionyl-tRNA formyltransferase